MTIQWCLTHDSRITGEICEQAFLIAYRTGGDPFRRKTCRVVSRLLVDPEAPSIVVSALLSFADLYNMPEGRYIWIGEA